MKEDKIIEENKQTNVCPYGCPCKIYLTIQTGKKAKFVKSVSDVLSTSIDKDDDVVQTLKISENDEVNYKQIKHKAVMKATVIMLVISAIVEALTILWK